MTDEEQAECDKAMRRYVAAMHAMQTGIALDIVGKFGDLDPVGVFGSTSTYGPKHVRVGLNARAVDALALANLLIAKGVFTQVEYCNAMADAMEAEKRRYEDECGHALG